MSRAEASDNGGGKIVAAGTPEDVAAVKESYTGRYLKDLLVRRSKSSGSKKQAAERDASQKMPISN